MKHTFLNQFHEKTIFGKSKNGYFQLNGQIFEIDLANFNINQPVFD